MGRLEPALEPDLPIIDPHHHLWEGPVGDYPAFPIETLAAERRACGHDIRGTVFVDCRQGYLADGPEELRPVGETRKVEALANAAEAAGEHGLAAGIVSHADMTLGERVESVLRAHMAESPARFRGVRHMAAWHEGRMLFGAEGRKELMRLPEFRDAVACLGKLGLTFDAFVLFPQLSDVAYLARGVPETTIVLNHVGAPAPLAGIPEKEGHELWRKGMAEVAHCPNVVLKLGGLLMGDLGGRDLSASEAAAAAMRDHLLASIDLFGPSRCMFESNFPVDSLAISYGNLWNAFKRATADFSRKEREAMFADVARRVYRLAI
jgi:predicted TIM-barrel fold metal-dependent hydrolase